MRKQTPIKIIKILWPECYRIIPSRYPAVNLYERVGAEEDFENLVELESQTNPRIRQENGELFLLDSSEASTGEGSGYINAAFTHLNPEGSRFSDGTFGVYYTAKTIETAIQETKFHRENFMKATQEVTAVLEMRVIVAKLNGSFHDVRCFYKTKKNIQNIYDPDSYIASRKLASDLRKQQSAGILYLSVRDSTNGECVAVFSPKALSEARSNRYLCYVWDGERISSIYEKKIFF